MRDLSSLTRKIKSMLPAVEAWRLNHHWTTGEVPILYIVLSIRCILKLEDLVLEEPHRTLGA